MSSSQGPQGSEEDGTQITIPIDRSFSDGDPSTWPTEARFGMPDDKWYREKLAIMWLKETGAYEEGMDYVIDVLPDGYAVFDRPRGTNPDIRDRFLYGHPIGQYFYSTVQFFPHFLYLMKGGSEPCPCILCEKLAKKNQRIKEGLPARGPGRPIGPAKLSTPGKPGRPPGRLGRPPGRPPGKPPGRPPGRPGRPPGRPPVNLVVDREGTPDVFKMAVMKLKDRRELDERIQEPLSMDWKSERPGLEEYLQKITMQASYIPRAGEVVLWVPSFDGHLSWNAEHACLEMYDPSTDRWMGVPEWRAGIVGQVPEEDTVLQDLVETASKGWGVNYSGFRVETFPDPHSTDKSYSLQYKYVHLKCIKPFNSFELFLQGLPRQKLHPSIEYAMTIMSSFSLLEKFHFRGRWPDASIYCRGIFIGAELLVVGDAVRLKPIGFAPENHRVPPVTDIMVIEEIRLDLIHCNDDVKSDQLAERYHIRIGGRVYTNNRQRACMGADPTKPPKPLSPEEVLSTFQYVGMSGYGEWYKLYSGKMVDTSQAMVIGRCYEPDAMRLLYGGLSLGRDLRGVMSGRKYSRRTDERIPQGQDWFWGDFRTQTLAIETLNGEDVGHYSEIRDVKMWRANLKVIAGRATAADLREAKIPGEVGRPSHKSRSTFDEVRKTSKLVSVGLGAGITDVSNNVSSADESHVQTRAGTGDEADGEEEDEEEEEDFILRVEDLRGGTEETEGGDYAPEDDEPIAKRAKHDL